MSSDDDVAGGNFGDLRVTFSRRDVQLLLQTVTTNNAHQQTHAACYATSRLTDVPQHSRDRAV